MVPSILRHPNMVSLLFGNSFGHDFEATQ